MRERETSDAWMVRVSSQDEAPPSTLRARVSQTVKFTSPAACLLPE